MQTLKARWFAAAFMAVGAAAAARAQNITYYIQDYPAQQSGWSLGGDIITDGNLGALNALDILSWEFTVTQGSTLIEHGPVSGTDYVYGTLTANSTSLTLPIPADPSSQENGLQLGNGFFDFPLIEWGRGSGDYPSGDWYHSRWQGFQTFWTDNVSTGALPLPAAGAPYIIATTTVPEPGSLTILLAGLGGFAIFLSVRRQKANSRSVGREYS